jgi:hypothetical protein
MSTKPSARRQGRLERHFPLVGRLTHFVAPRPRQRRTHQRASPIILMVFSLTQRSSDCTRTYKQQIPHAQDFSLLHLTLMPEKADGVQYQDPHQTLLVKRSLRDELVDDTTIWQNFVDGASTLHSKGPSRKSLRNSRLLHNGGSNY